MPCRICHETGKVSEPVGSCEFCDALHNLYDLRDFRDPAVTTYLTRPTALSARTPLAEPGECVRMS